MADVTRAVWRTSTRSNNGGNCVEVANLVDTEGAILVRDSKNPNGPVLSFTRGEWAAFVGAVEDGEFNL